MRCCVELKKKRNIHLLDTKNFTHRNIKIYNCPVCDAIRAELQQYNLKTGKFEYIRPKRKDTADFIRTYEAEPYIENIFVIKQGTSSNMTWIYFRNGNNYDFNEVKVSG